MFFFQLGIATIPIFYVFPLVKFLLNSPGIRRAYFHCVGYTLSVWIQFAKPGDPTAYTFLSNGGHSVQNHGVAMMYGRRSFEVRFKKKNGVQWTAISSDVLPQRWCHVAASWHPGRGLFLYVNGELVHAVNSSTSGTPVNPTNFNDFIIGRPNDATGLREVHQMLVDDFKFWSVFKSEREIRETG